jgi:predicted nucleic acid-binding Zn ribbon protein
MPPQQPERGPESLSEILSRLFTARGWGRRQDRLRLERAWAEAAGPNVALHTKVAKLARGVLEVIVDSAVLLQELAAFHKAKLLRQLKALLPGTPLTDLRFKAGVVNPPAG